MKSSMWLGQSGRSIQAILVGTSFVTGSLAYYQGLSNFIHVGGLNSRLLASSGDAVVALLLAGLVLTFWGLTRLVRSIGLGSPRNPSLTLRMMSVVAREKPYSLVFAFSALVYGVIFALASSILVYQPGIRFSSTYGVGVPSIVEVICCGSFGQLPQFVLYLTQNLALLFIPINVILLLAISWLVGLNVSLTVFAYRTRSPLPGQGWLNWFGAFVGLFTACPTCAGFFLLSMLGLASGLSFALAFSSIQGVFVAAGLLLLLLTPLITARRLGNEGKALCRLPNQTRA